MYINWKDRAHFCSIAATAMGQVLTNHARMQGAGKRDATVSRLERPREEYLEQSEVDQVRVAVAIKVTG
jgi:hypothetical protein